MFFCGFADSVICPSQSGSKQLVGLFQISWIEIQNRTSVRLPWSCSFGIRLSLLRRDEVLGNEVSDHVLSGAVAFVRVFSVMKLCRCRQR